MPKPSKPSGNKERSIGETVSRFFFGYSEPRPNSFGRTARMMKVNDPPAYLSGPAKQKRKKGT